MTAAIAPARTPLGWRGRFFGLAGLVNALGTGFYFPFSLLLFSSLLGVGYALVGLLLSITALVALPLLPVSGAVVDRVGSRAGVQTANLLRGTAFVALLLWPSLPLFVVLSVVIALTGRVDLIAMQALAADAAGTESQVPRWRALSRAVFAAGYGIGAASAGIALTLHLDPVAVGWVNAASFFTAAALYLPVRTTRSAPVVAAVVGEPAAEQVPTPAAVRRGPDRRYLLLAVSNGVFVASGLLLESMLGPFLLQHTTTPPWLSGALLGLNAGLLALLYLPLEPFLTRRRQLRLIPASGFLLAVGLLVLPLSTLTPPIAVASIVLTVGMLLYSAGELVGDQTIGSLLTVLPPPGQRGRHLGTAQIIDGVTAALVPLTAGTLIATNSPAIWTLVLLAVTAAALLPLHPVTASSLDRPLDQIAAR